MTTEVCKKFLEALNSANIKTYEFDTDVGSHFYHDGKTRITIPNHDLEALIAIRPANFAGASFPTYADKIQVVVSNYCDIHEVRAAGTCEQIKTFVESMGSSLTDEEYKIMLEIEHSNYDIKPETGNYVDRFKYLSKKQYDELSDEEKKSYDSEKEKYEEARKNYIGQNMAASISF